MKRISLLERMKAGWRGILSRIILLTLATATVCNLASSRALVYQQSQVTQDPIKQAALGALDDILNESKGYESLLLRVRVKIRVADALWAMQPERAKDLLSGAAGEIATLDLDATVRYRLRGEAISIAHKHDSQFAADFVAKLGSQIGDSPAVLMRDSAERISETGALFLDSAHALLRSGDQEGAVISAERSIKEGRSSRFLFFLDDLRKRDQGAADDLFLHAVASVRQTSADPNDILFLGLYLFAPGNVSFADVNGQLIVGQGINFSTAAKPLAALLHPYLGAAVDVLTRCAAPAQSTSPGLVDLKRAALQQLVPLLEKYLPDQAGPLRSELARVTSDAPSVASSQKGPSVENADSAPANDLSPADLIKKIQKVTGVRERDDLFFESGISCLDKRDFAGARALLSSIGDLDLKLAATEVVLFEEARNAVKRGDLEEGVRLASSGLTRERLATSYYNLAAAWLEKGYSERCLELVNAATTALAKVEDHTQRARIYISLAGMLYKVDLARTFDYLTSAFKDIDALKEFDVNDDRITFRIPKARGSIYEKNISTGVSVMSVVPRLAESDFDWLIRSIRLLRAQEPRALMAIAACQTVLVPGRSQEPQKTGVSTPKKRSGSN